MKSVVVHLKIGFFLFGEIHGNTWEMDIVGGGEYAVGP